MKDTPLRRAPTDDELACLEMIAHALRDQHLEVGIWAFANVIVAAMNNNNVAITPQKAANIANAFGSTLMEINRQCQTGEAVVVERGKGETLQ
ncbi:MAG: hypothetical protein AAFO77_08840 [Pseudomonadota bacterium]